MLIIICSGGFLESISNPKQNFSSNELLRRGQYSLVEIAISLIVTIKGGKGRE
jgi:hypothetical protein